MHGIGIVKKSSEIALKRTHFQSYVSYGYEKYGNKC